jgi:hypothetical protein
MENLKRSEIKTLSDIGFNKLKEIAGNNKIYTDFLKFQGRVFKQNATVAIEFYAQNPEVKFIASAKQWNSAGYKIKDGGVAIHFVDENGNHSDLFDLSQIEGGLAPKIWQINKESAEEVKAALNISEEDNLIGGLTAQTIDTSQITDCMAALDMPTMRKC